MQLLQTCCSDAFQLATKKISSTTSKHAGDKTLATASTTTQSVTNAHSSDSSRFLGEAELSSGEKLSKHAQHEVKQSTRLVGIKGLLRNIGCIHTPRHNTHTYTDRQPTDTYSDRQTQTQHTRSQGHSSLKTPSLCSSGTVSPRTSCLSRALFLHLTKKVKSTMP